MCEDIAPNEMKNYLEMLDRTEELEVEINEELYKGSGNRAELVNIKEFLTERRMMLEAVAGSMNDTHILVTPYAAVLRENKNAGL